MGKRDRGRALRQAAPLMLAMSLLAAQIASAAEECPTWFPDFSCERQARYEGFIAPMSNPYYFEDPFITTGVSLWALWHEFPEKSALRGGDATVLAAQVRVALTDRLAFIATKDGFAYLRPDNPVLEHDKGYFNWAFGFKYAAIDQPDDLFILTPSLRFETSNGSDDVLSGNGSGTWIPGLSVGKGVGDARVIADVGARLPIDGDEESSVLYYDLNLSHPVTPWLTPFVELSGLHYLDNGDGTNTIQTKLGRLPVSAVQAAFQLPGFEGYDVANLGSRGVRGHDILSWAIGARVPLRAGSSLGLAYQRPLTDRRDILKQRITLNVLLEY